MPERITANLPARSFDLTGRFYRALGFRVAFRDRGWMILTRGSLELEFFPHPTLEPADSWFSACVRVDDVDALFGSWGALALPTEGIPRLVMPTDDASGFRIGVLVDPDGSLLRCLTELP